MSTSVPIQKIIKHCTPYIPNPLQIFLHGYIKRIIQHKRYAKDIFNIIITNTFYYSVFPVIEHNFISLSFRKNKQEEINKLLNDATYIVANKSSWNTQIIKHLGIYYTNIHYLAYKLIFFLFHLYS